MTTPTRGQKILSTLSATGKQLGTAAKGAAIRTSHVLSQSWHEAREKTNGRATPPQQPPANINAAPDSAASKAAAAQQPPGPSDFQQALILMSQAYKVPDNDTQLMDALKGAQPIRFPSAEKPTLCMNVDGLLLDLTPREIHTSAEELTKAQAQRMIRFAAANPSMRKNGITIEGTDATRQLLEDLAAEAGLKILNPLNPPIAAQPAAEPIITQPVVTAPDVTPPVTTEAPADKAPAEPLPQPPAARASLPHLVKKMLDGGKVDHEKYYAARDFLQGRKDTNPHMLQRELGITRTKAKTILNALAVEGIVKIDEITLGPKERVRTIYNVAANPPDSATVIEAAAQPVTNTPADAAPKKPDAPKPV